MKEKFIKKFMRMVGDMKEKFIKKFMRMAKQVGEDDNSCYSRKIGTVIFNPVTNRVISTGYNSPPRDVPHCDTSDYLQEIVWPQLTPEEKQILQKKVYEKGEFSPDDQTFCNDFVKKFTGCHTCPRKLIGAKSGQRLEICDCAHSESNAIARATEDLYGCSMACYCGVPCFECTKLIINAFIKTVYVIDWGADYSFGSRWMFEKAGVEIVMHPPEWYLTE